MNLDPFAGVDEAPCHAPELSADNDLQHRSGKKTQRPSRQGTALLCFPALWPPHRVSRIEKRSQLNHNNHAAFDKKFSWRVMNGVLPSLLDLSPLRRRSADPLRRRSDQIHAAARRVVSFHEFVSRRVVSFHRSSRSTPPLLPQIYAAARRVVSFHRSSRSTPAPFSRRVRLPSLDEFILADGDPRCRSMSFLLPVVVGA